MRWDEHVIAGMLLAHWTTGTDWFLLAFGVVFALMVSRDLRALYGRWFGSDSDEDRTALRGVTGESHRVCERMEGHDGDHWNPHDGNSPRTCNDCGQVIDP